jgi:hypothetical protein
MYGIDRREGAFHLAAASRMRIGISTITTGVLFMKAHSSPPRRLLQQVRRESLKRAAAHQSA